MIYFLLTCLYVGMPHVLMCPWKSNEDKGFLGAQVSKRCELPNVVAFLLKIAKCT